MDNKNQYKNHSSEHDFIDQVILYITEKIKSSYKENMRIIHIRVLNIIQTNKQTKQSKTSNSLGDL